MRSPRRSLSYLKPGWLRATLEALLPTALAIMGTTVLSAQTLISIDWQKPLGQVKTGLTIQECPEPPLLPGHSLHDAAMFRLRELKADDARIQFWFPYPKMSVAELQAPSNGHTSWDFRLTDAALIDFYRAAEGRPVMVNLSTLPVWMLKTNSAVGYPEDPDAIDWDYNTGTELRDSSLKELTGYYRRVAEWYIKGGFRDEAGVKHNSGHHLKFDYWEVLNEIDVEHKWSPETYSRIYDAVVAELQPIDPKMRFSGLAIAGPAANLDYFEYFLDPAHHAKGTPLDMISYHFYIKADKGEDIDFLQKLFYQRADGVLETVGKIEAIRTRLSPNTKTYINELGTMWMDGEKVDNPPAPDRYWTLSSAVFAYTYLGLVRQGIDLVGSAELIDYPGQYAGTSLLNWDTGEPFARYYVTRELIKSIRPGDEMYTTRSSDDFVSAQAFSSGRGRLLVLVNKLHSEQRVKVSAIGSIGSRTSRLLVISGPHSAPESTVFSGPDVVLPPDGVALLSVPSGK